jgi:hypothetical protein
MTTLNALFTAVLPHISDALFALYSVSAVLLALYTLGQFALLVQMLRPQDKPQQTAPSFSDVTPDVTIQLPIYNERYVVERLLEAIAQLDYPRQHLHIQVLDDSTDDTHTLITQHVAQLRRRGFRISHHHRTQRTGYKAGALSEGLAQSDAEYIAIFDADFVPAPDFLRRTLAVLQADESIGMVQTRWEHLNADENNLTRAQRLAVDAHFIVEQTGRARAGWLVPFNGTGGVWRRTCIDDAGGWSWATLTEDFDLSYRAQLRGWRATYLPDCVVPAELPAQMASYRQQQMRWAMGSTQCLKRLLVSVWQAQHLSWGTRVMATHHLLQYVPHLLMVILLWLTPWLLLMGRLENGALAGLGIVGALPPVMLGIAQAMSAPNMGAWWRRMSALPMLILLATGTSVANGRAVWRALRGHEEAFKRTPKFATSAPDGYAGSYRLRALPIGEALHALYAWWAVVLAGLWQPTILPYLLLYALAFTWVTLVLGHDVIHHVRPIQPMRRITRRDNTHAHTPPEDTTPSISAVPVARQSDAGGVSSTHRHAHASHHRHSTPQPHATHQPHTSTPYSDKHAPQHHAHTAMSRRTTTPTHTQRTGTGDG